MKFKDIMFQEQKGLYMDENEESSQKASDLVERGLRERFNKIKNEIRLIVSKGTYVVDTVVYMATANLDVSEREARDTLAELTLDGELKIKDDWTVVRVDKKPEQKEDFDPVNKPKHYASGKIQPIEAIEDWGLGYNLGNCVKYLSRAGKKDKSKEKEDLQKALFYLSREIANLDKKK